eukprot:6186464-Pleurochrysis_carterae.AAC.2
MSRLNTYMRRLNTLMRTSFEEKCLGDTYKFRTESIAHPLARVHAYKRWYAVRAHSGMGSSN